MCFRELERARKEMEEKEEKERMKRLQEEELLRAKKARKKNDKDPTKKKVTAETKEVCLNTPAQALCTKNMFNLHEGGAQLTRGLNTFVSCPVQPAPTQGSSPPNNSKELPQQTGQPSPSAEGAFNDSGKRNTQS